MPTVIEAVSELLNELISNIIDNKIYDDIDYQNDRKEAFDESMRLLREDIYSDDGYLNYYCQNCEAYECDCNDYDDPRNSEEYIQKCKELEKEFGDGTDGCGNYVGYGNTDVFDIGSNGTCDF